VQTGESVEYMSLSLQALVASVEGDLVPALGKFAEATQPDEYAAALEQQAASEKSAEIRVEKPTFYKEVKSVASIIVIHHAPPLNLTAIFFAPVRTSETREE
jgi:hypothetical protein